ncbi:MAG: hypothetical protein JJ891_15990 [Rhizobiaceae bacterium]|nr:hypothetical protein [Rhizobiaceae bacterium]
MTEQISITSSLSLLQQLYPPKLLLHVGAGGPSGPFRAFAQTAQTSILVDADQERFERLRTQNHDVRSTIVLNAAIGQQGGLQTFFTHSLEGESGFVDAGSLCAVWPNIEAVGQEQIEPQTAKQLFADKALTGLEVSSCNWLVIGCLPAVDMLKACEDVLVNADVVFVRVYLPSGDAASGLASSSRRAVLSLMREHGFLELGVETERNKNLGMAVYARDWRMTAHQRTAETTREMQAQLQAADEEAENIRERYRKELAAKDKEASEARQKHQDELQAASQKLAEAESLAAKFSRVEENLKQVEADRDRAQSEISAAGEAAEIAGKRQQVAENSLEQMREKYEMLASVHLEAEEKLVNLGRDIRRILAVADGAEDEAPDADTSSKRRVTKSTRKAAKK